MTPKTAPEAPTLFTHGFHCSYDLRTAAIHYVRVMELVREQGCRPDRLVVLVTHDERIFDVASRRLHIEDGRCFDVPIHYH